MFERMNYFTGRHLAARDFSDEQLYHRGHRYLHNRMLHGWGVVCGFEVKQHPQADCRTKYVQVGPGMAIDCCGREIVVDHPSRCLDDQLEIPWDEYQPSHPLLMLCLCYHEEPREPVPVLHSEGDCATAEKETRYGRIHEGWRLCWRWISPADLKKYRWNPLYGCQEWKYEEEPERQFDVQPATQQESPAQATSGQASESALAQMPHETDHETEPESGADDRKHEHPEVHFDVNCPHDDCADPYDPDFISCVAPRCPPAHCVPLALICVRSRQPITDDLINMKGRPRLPYGPQSLTHVARINWPHGGVVSPRWLESNSTLRVTFDRKVKPAPPPQYELDYPAESGINQATFVLQFGEQYEDLDFVLYEEPPRLLDDQLTAAYKIAPRSGRHGRYNHLEGHTIWVTLKCDFIYDCHDVRVDGNNNGTAGGVFESWFTVINDDEYERYQGEERS
jgi:hypothetical protein